MRTALDRLVGAKPLPLSVGVAVATSFIGAEALLVYWFQKMGSEHSFRALFLLGVLVVSAGCGLGLALTTSFVSGLVYFYFHLGHAAPIAADDFISLLVFLPIAFVANVLGWLVRMRAAEAENRRREADVAASLARRLAEQQAALRRVATLVARGTPPTQIYPAAVAELSRGLRVENVVIVQYGPDGASVVVDARDQHGNVTMPEGALLSMVGDNLAARIQRNRRPERMDYVNAEGPIADRMRSMGILLAIGAPIVVDDRAWGAVIVGSARSEPPPPDTELRVADFADLIATAIGNASTRAELNASRARIVAAADQARQRFERDLHDGAQQHVVSLALQLRAVETMIAPDQDGVRRELSSVIAGLSAVAVELREFSHGMHPSILSTRGLDSAIQRLARRSAIPVSIDLDVTPRMPERVEVAAYYIVAEALTNAAKYSRASEVTVRARIKGGSLHLTIRDNGIGGATVGNGSGLIGLRDRVEVLGGQFEIISPYGFGTTIVVRVAVDTI